MLMLSVLPGFAMHGFQAAQTVAATHSTPEMRAQALGQITLSYSIGFVAGSAVLVTGGKQLKPRTIATAAAGLEALFVAVLLKGDYYLETERADRETTRAAAAETASFAESLSRFLNTEGVPRVLAVKFCIISGSGLVLNMVPQFALDPFGATASQSGLLMAYMSAVGMMTQAYAGRYLDEVDTYSFVDAGRHRLPPAMAVTMFGAGTISLSFLAMAMPELGSQLHAGYAATLQDMKWPVFAFCIGPAAGAQQIVLIAMSSYLTKLASDQDLGLVLGVDMAIWAGSGIATPMLSAFLTRNWGFEAVPLAGTFISSAVAIIMVSDMNNPHTAAPAVGRTAPAAPRAYRRSPTHFQEDPSEIGPIRLPAAVAVSAKSSEL